MPIPYVTTEDQTRLSVKDWGSGRPILFLHGWPLSSDSWDDQAMAMAMAEAGHRSVACDGRGFGRSSQPWSGYDYDTLADDLAAVIEQTGAHDATLLGVSMGGGEVARYMSRHGGKSVVKAALVSSVVLFMLKTGDHPDGTDQATFDGMLEAMKVDRAKFFGGFIKDFYGVGLISHPVSAEMLEWSRGVAMQASLKATLECAKALAATDFRLDPPAFEVPTTVIHGTTYNTLPSDAAGRLTGDLIQAMRN